MQVQEIESYIGIDVSKTILDITILPSNKIMQFTNNHQGIRKLIKKIKNFYH